MLEEDEVKNVEELLPVASDIRALVDEIIRRIGYLPEEDKTPDSPHLLSLFDFLASIIAEEIIVEATVFADSGAVVLHTGSSNTQGKIQNQPGSTPIPDDKELEQEIIEEMRENNEDLDELDTLPGEFEFTHNLEKSSHPAEATAPPLLYKESIDIFDDLEEEIPQEITMTENIIDCQVDDFARSLSLNSQPVQIAANSLSDTNLCESDEELSMSSERIESQLPPPTVDKGLRFYEVVCKNTQGSIYILPHVNYCSCDFFKKNVIEKRKDFTCCHVLATWLSEALGSTRIVHSTPDTLQHMIEFFLEPLGE